MGIDGAVLIDKPCGPTSHDIVAFVRRTLKISRVGHTGTLDPLATGLLVVLLGPATRLAQFLVADEKEYIADVRLGVATPTYDAASLEEARGARREALEVWDGRGAIEVGITSLESILDEFRGTFMQRPPPFSAKKIEGVRAYQMARKNQPVELKPVEVTVRELEVLPTSDISGLLRLRVAASSGFYVRSLAHDIGQRLGCGAHLEALRRTRVGRFRIEDTCTLDTLEADGAGARCLIPMNALLADMPAVSLTDEGVRRAGNGNSLAPHHVAGRPPPVEARAMVRLLDAAGEVLAVAERRADGLLHPLVVLG